MNCRNFVASMCYFETPKIVKIKSIPVGIFSRLLQVTILSYIIGYAIIYRKGYQEFSEVESSVTTKVKGVAYSNFPNDAFNPVVEHPEWYRRIWDTADFVVPPQENGATFIGTNVIISSEQFRTTCAEDPSITGALCEFPSNCTKGEYLSMGHGIMTGNCIKFSDKNTNKTCEIEAWCPLEKDVLPLNSSEPVIAGSENFTVLIKNFVDFPKFSNSNRRNIKDTSNKTYLTSCIYDAEHNPECPVFRLGDIVRWTGNEYDEVASQGAIIAVTIKWSCNFDFNKKDCFPTYSFNRLDNSDAKIAPGWNFRYANFYGDSKRTLYKLYGIRLVVIVQGQAGKFAIVPLLLNIGSGLGLLALEVFIMDIVVLYLVKRRQYYKSKKYQEVKEDESSSDEAPQIEVEKPSQTNQDVENSDGYGYHKLHN